MPQTSKKTVTLAERAFFHYLNDYYVQNRRAIRKSYTLLTKKFLDFNDPDNSGSFLRRPQFEAFEIYVFLKEFCNNRFLQDVFHDWKLKTGLFANRPDVQEDQAGQKGLFEEQDTLVLEQSFQTIHDQIYPNYIFALTMGIGKTILMAASIFYEFLLANKYPRNERFCHNALVFAPDKTVLQSLKEIQTFDKSLVVPPEYVNWLETHLQFHYLDESGISLNLIDKSDFNIIISNTQKIILKRRNKQPNATVNLFSADADLYRPGFSTDDFSDLLELELGDEIGLRTNQRFQKLTRLQQLGIYVDEAHHIFGNKLASDMQDEKNKTSLRNTINSLAKELSAAGTHVVACYNYTGTPYAANKLLPQVVYFYGLADAINKKYLKKVRIIGSSNTKSKEFVKLAIKEFWQTYGENRVENKLPKIAFFASTIDELEQELRPAVEDVLASLDIPQNKILINVGDDALTSNDDIREFINLDRPESEKQFILLVNKGKEGWNCRSLFAVGLHRKPKSKIFVLQATMRCLRSIGETQQTARVYLSEENVEILDTELQNNFRIDVEILKNAGDAKKQVQVKIVEPPKKVKMTRIQKLYRQKEKTPAPGIDFGLENLNASKYEIFRTERDITNIDHRAISSKKLDDLKENRPYSSLTLIAELARYLNKSPIYLESLLFNSKEGITKILTLVNQYNEIIYDFLIPKLFHELYDLVDFVHKEEYEVNLVNPPKDGSKFFTFTVDPNLLAERDDPKFAPYKEKSFHLDKYCFDSKPENTYFWHLLTSNLISQVYFTGMLTQGQSDFRIYYIDPESHTLRSYYPDFFVQTSNGNYEIIEIKADYLIDDAVVRAKQLYAQELAGVSGMIYKIIRSSQASSIKQK